MGHKVKNLFIAMSVAAGATAMDAAVPMPASAGNPADYCPDQPCIPDTPCGPHKPPHHGGGKKVIINKSYTKKITINKNTTTTNTSVHNDNRVYNINVDRGARNKTVFVGGSTTFIEAPKAVTPLGQLTVVVPNAVEKLRKPVKGVCQDAKGLEEAARMSVPNKIIEAGSYVGEVFHCLSGDMMVVTLGRFLEDGTSTDYQGGYTFECQVGSSLHVGEDGRVACGPASDLAFNSGAAPRARFAEIILQKTTGGPQMSQVGDTSGLYLSGGVGN